MSRFRFSLKRFSENNTGSIGALAIISAGIEAQGKTVMVVSDDDKYYYLADRIVKLDYGQLADDKTTAIH
jgi:hypothetical protein